MYRCLVSVSVLALCASCSGGGGGGEGDEQDSGEVAQQNPVSEVEQQAPGVDQVQNEQIATPADTNGRIPDWCLTPPISRIYGGEWVGTLTPDLISPSCQWDVVLTVAPGPDLIEDDNLLCFTSATMRVQTTNVSDDPTLSCQEITEPFNQQIFFPQTLNNLTIDLNSPVGFILSSDLPDPIVTASVLPDEDQDNFPQVDNSDPTNGLTLPVPSSWGFLLTPDITLGPQEFGSHLGILVKQ